MKRAALLLGTFLPSPLRVALLRALGFKVGKNVHISPLSVVVADDIELGEGAVVDPLTLIYAPGKLKLGERCRIASFNRIVGHRGNATFEAQSFVALGCLIDVSNDFTLGRRSQLGPRGTYYTHGESGLVFSQRYPLRNGPIVIGEDVTTGMNVIMYPRVTVESGSVIFAGVTLHKNIPAGSAVMPASEVLTRTVPVRNIRMGITPEFLAKHLESKLVTFAEAAGATVEERDGRSIAKIPRFGSIVIGDAKGEPPGTVIWQLEPKDVDPRHTVFDFGKLEIRGPQTANSDYVAAMACAHLGLHFAYATERAEASTNGAGQPQASS